MQAGSTLMATPLATSLAIIARLLQVLSLGLLDPSAAHHLATMSYRGEGGGTQSTVASAKLAGRSTAVSSRFRALPIHASGAAAKGSRWICPSMPGSLRNAISR